MAVEDSRKKIGTIFMGDREASVEQLNAMQEPLRREKLRQEQTEDYMERVRARAADRAREILGAAYAERQKVLDEAKMEILAQKREASEECAKMRAEGEIARKMAQTELEKAKAEREEAERIKANAQEDGFQAGMDKADVELHEFRAAQGQALASVLHALERERNNIISYWREDISLLVQCAAQAGTTLVLEKEHEAVLRSLVFKALDLLESQGTVTLRVNPADETTVSDMFQLARERFPDLRQWIVTGDEQIEPGGLIAESGSGSIDMKRENFRQMLDNILTHLALPEEEGTNPYELRDLVEREVAHIASLTPELEPVSVAAPEEEIITQQEPEIIYETQEEPEIFEQAPDESAEPVDDVHITQRPNEETDILHETEVEPVTEEIYQEDESDSLPEDIEFTAEDQTSLKDLEDELFPVEETQSGQVEQEATGEEKPAEKPDPTALAEGGFI